MLKILDTDSMFLEKAKILNLPNVFPIYCAFKNVCLVIEFSIFSGVKSKLGQSSIILFLKSLIKLCIFMSMEEFFTLKDLEYSLEYSIINRLFWKYIFIQPYKTLKCPDTNY